MIILDTNVLSALARPSPEVTVLKWLDGQPESSIWTTSITLMEIRFGLHTMPVGRRRELLARQMEDVLTKEIGERYLFVDAQAAAKAAELMAERKLRGHTVELRDTLIAGIALASRAVLATRNVLHFADLSVPVVNPWEA